MRSSAGIILILFSALWGGCGHAWVLKENKKEVIAVKDVAPDSGMLRLTRPYKEQMQLKMDEVIGTAADELEVGIPQGKLGNFAADELLAFAREQVDAQTSLSLLNNGGLRAPIRKGNITVGNIFELMPFDNELVILSLDGASLDSLLTVLVARFHNQHDIRSVFPMSGISLTLDKTGKYYPEIGGRGIVADSVYRIATTDYLAGGGDQLAVLKRAKSITQSGYFVRDIFITRIRDRKSPVDSQTDLRFIIAY